jgi:hypothetical protein
VRFRVTGKDITQIDGKPAAQKPFEFVATCRLTGDMDGFPRITALEGATASKASEASAAPRKKKRRHR